MGVYVGLGEESKEISGIYLGAEESIKEVSEGYVGDAEGNINPIISSVEPGQQVFTSSGTFTVPKGVKSVDVFLVGGGGAGGPYRWGSSGTHGSGGGGGYTTTSKGISVIPGNEYEIVVGSGGGSRGGTSSAFGSTAEGGYQGWQHVLNESNDSYYGCGGSGGGIDGTAGSAGDGGSNGGNGWICDGDYNTGKPTNHRLTAINYKSKGQGTTTKAFGESSGTLYAGGGGGGDLTTQSIYDTYYFYGWGGSGGGGTGAISGTNGSREFSIRQATAGSDGTGGGGGGAGCCYDNYGSSKQGGSGCVIIRWGYK